MLQKSKAAIMRTQLNIRGRIDIGCRALGVKTSLGHRNESFVGFRGCNASALENIRKGKAFVDDIDTYRAGLTISHLDRMIVFRPGMAAGHVQSILILHRILFCRLDMILHLGPLLFLIPAAPRLESIDLSQTVCKVCRQRQEWLSRHPDRGGSLKRRLFHSPVMMSFLHVWLALP